MQNIEEKVVQARETTKTGVCRQAFISGTPAVIVLLLVYWRALFNAASEMVLHCATALKPTASEFAATFISCYGTCVGSASEFAKTFYVSYGTCTRLASEFTDFVVGTCRILQGADWNGIASRHYELLRISLIVVVVLLLPLLVAILVRAYFWTKNHIRLIFLPLVVMGNALVSWFTIYKRYCPLPPVEEEEIDIPPRKEAEVVDLTDAEYSFKVVNGMPTTVIRCADGKVFNLPDIATKRVEVLTKTDHGFEHEKLTKAAVRKAMPATEKSRKGLVGFYYRTEDGIRKFGTGVRVGLRGLKVSDQIVTNAHVYDEALSLLNDGYEVKLGNVVAGKLLTVTITSTMLEKMNPKRIAGVDIARMEYDACLLAKLQIAKATLAGSRQPGLLTIATFNGEDTLLTSARVGRTAMPFIASHDGSTEPGWSGAPAYTLKGLVFGIHSCAFKGVERNGLVLLASVYSDVPPVLIGGLTKETWETKNRENAQWFNRNYDMHADQKHIEAVFGDLEAETAMYVDSNGRKGRLTPDVRQMWENRMDELVDRADEIAAEYEMGSRSWYLAGEEQEIEDEMERIHDTFEFWDDVEEGNADFKRRVEASIEDIKLKLGKGFYKESGRRPAVGYTWRFEEGKLRVSVLSSVAGDAARAARHAVAATLIEQARQSDIALRIGVDDERTTRLEVIEKKVDQAPKQNRGMDDDSKHEEKEEPAPKLTLMAEVSTEARKTPELEKEEKVSKPSPIANTSVVVSKTLNAKKGSKKGPKSKASWVVKPSIAKESLVHSVKPAVVQNLADAANVKLLVEALVMNPTMQQLITTLVKQPTDKVVSEKMQDFSAGGALSRCAPLSQ